MNNTIIETTIEPNKIADILKITAMIILACINVFSTLVAFMLGCMSKTWHSKFFKNNIRDRVEKSVEEKIKQCYDADDVTTTP